MLTRHDEVGIITIDHAPVNALTQGVARAISEAVEEAAGDEAVHAIVVRGAGRVFVAGADIAAIQAAPSGDAVAGWLAPVLRQIEDCPKPVIMAIHGVALGGGLELAMAGHYRIAARQAQLGLPEANLGLIPGWAGTQRLPRLAGVPTALRMCVTAEPLSGDEAKAAGLVDLVADGDVCEAALAFARSAFLPLHKTREIAVRDSSAEAFRKARELAVALRPGQIAPVMAIEAIEAAATLSFEDGCHEETKRFSVCLPGEQAKAMIHLFQCERDAAKPPVGAKAKPLKDVTLLGQSDPRLFAVPGLTLHDGIQDTLKLDAVASEDESLLLSVKSQVRPDCLLLYQSPRAGHFTGVWITGKMLQITRGPETSDADVATLLLLARKLGLQAVQGAILPQEATAPPDELVRQTSVLAAHGRRLLESGVAARPGDIDVAYVHGWGYPAQFGGPMWHAGR